MKVESCKISTNLTGGGLYKKKNNPDVLNILRVIATLMVFVCHGNSYISDVYENRNCFSFLLSAPAWAGVWIFLFLGSYLFAYGVENNKYPFKKRLKFSDTIYFYIHRFLRLAPMYYLYILLYIYFSGNNFLLDNYDVLLQIITFTYNGEIGVEGIGHLWYISLNMQMYILMPFIYYILAKIKNNSVLINLFFAFLFGGLAIRVLRDNLVWYSDVYTYWFCNLDITICGIILAMLKKRHFNNFNPNLIIKIFTVCAFISLLVYNCWIYFYFQEGNNLYLYSYILPTVYITACSSLLISFQGNETKINNGGFLNFVKGKFWYCISKFSKYSYGFYIFHIGAFMFLNHTLLTYEWYSDSLFYLRYFLYFISAFTVSVIMSILFTRFTVIKKNHSK